MDLFAGAGGLTRGLKAGGFRIIGAVESDDLAVETYQVNFPEVHLWHRDIRRVTASELMRVLRLRRGQLDLLAACPPCEGFSRIRTKNGRRRPRDPRNDLVLETLRFIKGLRPKMVLLENVPALAKNERLMLVRKELRNLGYLETVRVIDAADYGIPQRRQRMILLASRVNGLPSFPRERPRTTVRDVLSNLPKPGRGADPLHDHGEHRSTKVIRLISSIPRNGGGRLHLSEANQLRCHLASDGFKDVYGRMAWDSVAPTITGGCVNPSKGRFLHPSQNRSITLREAALLQTFPKSHFFSLSRGKFRAAELIGNAVPPALVRLQAVMLHKHLECAQLAETRRRRRRDV